MRKRVPVLKDGKVLRDENGNVLEFWAVNQDELDNKIDKPQVAKVGEVLTVEEVDAEGKPKKWKTQTVETEPPDWNKNDPTKPGYVKNRTHYDSRHAVELFNTTVENTSLPFVKVADVDIDVAKINRVKMNVQLPAPDAGVDTLEFDSDGGEITQDDLNGDGSCIVTKIEKTTGAVGQTFLLPYFKTNEVADKFTKTTGIYTAGLYVLVEAEIIKGTFVGFGGNAGELKTIDPKFIEDMYYKEIVFDVVGSGLSGWWKSTNGGESPIIKKMCIGGQVIAENLAPYKVEGIDFYYQLTSGSEQITLQIHAANAEQYRWAIFTPSIEVLFDDFDFYDDTTVYHPVPDEYLPNWIAKLDDIPAPEIKLIFRNRSSTNIMLNKDETSKILAITLTNLGANKQTPWLKCNGWDIISSKTGNAITSKECPYFSMLLVQQTDSNYTCMNPL